MERALIPSGNTKQIASTNNHVLELYIEKVSKDLLQHKNNRKSVLPDNLPEESRKALNEMKKWKKQVIRPSDKGSTFFIMDRDDYIQRVETHLQDPSTFIMIQNKKDAIALVTKKITEWTINYREEPGMTKNIVEWIVPDESNKSGNNYVNPKAHRPEKNYPGRMISTGCASFTKNLSALTAYELNKAELKYVLQDTNHLLRNIEDINRKGIIKNKEILHVTLDVENMFPSITKSVGLEECRKRLELRTEPLFSKKCTLDALEITLDHNLTKFNNKMYCQIKGTAMGPKNACIYADIGYSHEFNR